jgi:hypothetical protein
LTKEERLHNRIKSLLAKAGKEEGYTTYSGDTECVDIRFKKKRVEYKPDVIWKGKISSHVFEVAFTEDWRAVVGEFVMAHLAEFSSFTVCRLHVYEHKETEVAPSVGVTRACTVTNVDIKNEKRFFENLLSFLGTKYGMKAHLHTVLMEKTVRKEKMKGKEDTRFDEWCLLKDLRRWNLISEETYRKLTPVNDYS